MSALKQNLTELLGKAKIMQVATARDNKPWVVSVFYIADDELNFYWLSLPGRRHSKEIQDNSNAAVTIAIKQNLPVIGIYAEGKVSVTKGQAEVKKVAEAYVKKHDAAKTFYTRFAEGINQHWVYKLKPTSITLFDEHKNADNPVQILKLGD